MRTHVAWVGGRVALDGHDLSAKVYKAALKRILDALDDEPLEAAAMDFVVGSGSHSLGGRGVLGDITTGVLGPAAAARGWTLRRIGTHTYRLVTDPERAARAGTATDPTDRILVAMGLALALATAVAVLHRLGML